jgi:pilus assembly protein Flp/PilA
MSGIYRVGLTFTARVRGGGDRGQTAAEYMGIVVIVAIIIVAIATSGLGTTIAGNITTKITEIFGAK